jgi:hypothetical protein
VERDPEGDAAMPDIDRRPDHQMRLKWRKPALLVTAGVLLALYGGSYYHLSRRGLREAKPYGMHGFLYVPIEEVLQSKDLSRHYRLETFYAPANWVDQILFNGDGPVRDIMWGSELSN